MIQPNKTRHNIEVYSSTNIFYMNSPLTKRRFITHDDEDDDNDVDDDSYH
jgi:hypothetical protein